MSKKKQNGKQVEKSEKTINLLTAVVNLVIAIILLLEKLKS